MYAGLLFVVGGALFVVGAAHPAFFRVWTSRDEVALPIIAAHRGAWRLVNLLMTAGPFLVVVGAVELVADATGVSRVAAAGLAAATLAWLPTPTFRLVAAPAAAERLATGAEPDPAERLVGRWLSVLFGLFTIAAGLALVALGADLAAVSSSPIWSWIAAGLGVVSVVGYLATGDMPPGVVFLGVLAAGAALLGGIPGDPTAG